MLMGFTNISLSSIFLALTCLFLQPLESVYILRYSAIAENGAIIFTGNTLGLSKQTNQNQPGTSDAIGAFITLDTTQQVGTYPPGTTLNYSQNSSAAILSLPPGSTVLHAELIWSGSYGYFNNGANIGEDPNIVLIPANGPITFTTPDSVAHAVNPTPLTSQNVQNPTVSYAAGNYVRSADVTALVQANGSGTYSVGGVPATVSALDNTHNAAGWTLAVVYRNPTLSTQNMSIFVGCEQASLTTNNPAVVEGFCTPPEGSPLSGRLYVSAIEGDANKVGDQMFFGPTPTTLTPLSGPNNGILNFFCSQINNSAGLLDTTGTFGTLNAIPPVNANPGRQGYDITSVDLTPTLIHNQTAGYAIGTTVGDDYTINSLGIQILVDSPFIQTSKLVNDELNIQSNIGNVVTFTTTLQNTGSSPAFNVLFTDNLELGLVLVPGTFTVDGIIVDDPHLIAGVPLPDLPAGSPPVTVQFQAIIRSRPLIGNTFFNSAFIQYDFVPCSFTGDPITLVAQSNLVSITLPDPEPIPPTNFTGKVTKCQYLTSTEYFLAATLTPVVSPDLIGYRIYFRGQVVTEIPPQGPLVFRTCLKNKNSASDYSVAAVFTGNIESTHTQIRILP